MLYIRFGYIYIHARGGGTLPFACRSYIWGGPYFTFFFFFVFGMGDCSGLVDYQIIIRDESIVSG